MLNETLRLLRVFHDMKVMDLSHDLGISSSYLSEIEKGKKKPSLDLIDRYAKVFDIKPSTIMYFSEDLDQSKPMKNLKVAIRSKMFKFLQYVENGHGKTI